MKKNPEKNILKIEKEVKKPKTTEDILIEIVGRIYTMENTTKGCECNSCVFHETKRRINHIIKSYLIDIK